ncbi:hypothetical protein D4764_21G0006820 [Takifugu flavidus]|uniref:Murine leukemia virus integrase C-terminal domain-containing protein n=1 Tax=Takifugu flavidus TaxID=433684 RepID=A0A5C6NE76_9TELE|nr:hypothetical protein D4764_21G0006820 [Takifugu flavidus]
MRRGERETDPGILGWSARLKEVGEAPRSHGREAFVGEQEDFMSKTKLHQRGVEVDEDEGWPLEVCVAEAEGVGEAKAEGEEEAIPVKMIDSTTQEPIQPGDYVWVKKFVRKRWNTPRWEGPYQESSDDEDQLLQLQQVYDLCNSGPSNGGISPEARLCLTLTACPFVGFLPKLPENHGGSGPEEINTPELHMDGF